MSNNCGFSSQALSDVTIQYLNEKIAALELVVKNFTANNSQSVTELDCLRSDVMQTNLPYKLSWAGRISEVIQLLNDEASLHT